jgi:TonB family protein
MPPIVKESGVTPGTVTANPPVTSTLPDASPSRPQPVALEVSVTVNGARTVEGSEKREPFSETTKTVLVFSHGAVIRLASTVAPGQLLFVTNEKTKKEVVCQVVKSKNYRNVSGYVELEFTEPVVGFWGMRFPNDRIGPPPPPAPKVEMPMASVTSEAVKARPVTSKPVEVSVKPLKAPVPAAPLVARPESPAILIPATPPASVSTLPQTSYAKPSIQTQPPAPKNPEPATGSTEALRLKTARLQEQLSSMQFSSAPAAKTPLQQPVNLPVEKKETWDATAKIIESAPADNAAFKLAPPARTIPPVPMPSLDEESVKIPAWLEPLARNTLAPSSTQELLEREKARRAAEKLEISEPEVETVAIAEVKSVPEVKVPSFGSDLLWDEKKGSEEKVSRGSNKGMFIGAVAAGLILLVGGGAWYLRPQAGSVNNSVTSASVPAAVSANVLRPQPAVSPQTNPANNLAAVPPQTVASSRTVNSQIATPHDRATPTPAVTTNVPVAQKSVQPVPVQQEPLVLQQLEPNKPLLGEVHLAAPKIHRGASSQQGGAAEPGLVLNGEQITPGSDSLGGELVAGSAKEPTAPAAPLAVGGDVTPAKMISSVQPVYSSLARTQHVSGDVKIDALIDANGRVTSMKVISGPTLLHQAATDALRQWKYKPATLDGKPVPMHLTVTLQFRLQ